MEEEKKELKKQTRRKITKDNENKNAKKVSLQARKTSKEKKEQAKEKSLWLDKYMPFIKEKNRSFVISQNFESRKKVKIDKIREKMNSNECELAILIDDTHDILFLALSELKERVIPFHVITLID